MTSNTKPIDNEESVVFADLEPLLRKSLNSSQLQVIEYTATKLVPIGENYSSLLIKINAKIRRSQDAKEERLHLAAKTINRIPRPILDWALSIKKEIFAYHDLLPVYKDLEREVGIAENELIDILPKYIGHRYSLDETSEVLDDDSLLLMENMKALGYYNCNRQIGLDIHHAKKALTAVARYHALGVTLKQKRPDFFAKAVTQARVLGIDFDQLFEGFDALFNDFRKDPSLVGKHLSLLESNYDDFKNGDRKLTISSDETWSTLTHGDFWVNNMLFHKDNHGNVDDVKLIDFQVLLFNSALKDLPYFLTGSLDDTTINHIDELIDIHYKTFIRTLERMGIDTKVFTRESYDKEMKKQAINEFPLCALATKFFVHEVNAQEKIDGLMAKIFESEISDVFRKRVARLVHTYEKKGWF